MVSIGLAIPRTRFPSVEPTWEFTPLSHEPGAICMWEAGESGREVMSTHASVLVDSVGPPSAEVCRAVASFP
jgi:hypothetical protein